MAEPDDHRWFATLAGHRPEGAATDDTREAEAVRVAVLAAHAEREIPDHDVETGTQRLLFRLRRENLLYRRKSWQFYGGLAIAATLALAIGIVTMQPPPDETPVYRGIGTQIITTPDTDKFATTLTAELEALGIKPKVTRFGANYAINAEWPPKPDAKHAAFLKRHGLKHPPSGMLVIELSPAASPK